jgi:hypothetical protein
VVRPASERIAGAASASAKIASTNADAVSMAGCKRVSRQRAAAPTDFGFYLASALNQRKIFISQRSVNVSVEHAGPCLFK